MPTRALLVRLLLSALIVWPPLRLFWPPARLYGPERVGPDALAQLRFLKGELEDGMGDKMQGLFPEGFFFSYALYGLTWVEVGQREAVGSQRWREAVAEAAWALAALDSPAAAAPFPPALEPPRGIFYVGWRSWLRGGLLRLQPAAARDPAQLAQFEADCAAIAQALARSESPFLPAYTGMAWPVDSVVAVAALRLHDSFLPPHYEAPIAAWLASAQGHLDPQTGLLPHRTDPRSGAPLEGARATSQSVIARFLIEIDPAWGRAQYARFREQFVVRRLGVPAVREYPVGQAAGQGDVDSGPLIAGISLSATVVTLGAAQLHNDRALADPLRHAGELLGLPLTWNGERRYLLGALPIGDAFLVWAKNARPWLASPAPESWPAIAAPGWRLGWLVLAGLLLAWLWRAAPRKSPRPQAATQKNLPPSQSSTG